MRSTTSIKSHILHLNLYVFVFRWPSACSWVGLNVGVWQLLLCCRICSVPESVFTPISDYADDNRSIVPYDNWQWCRRFGRIIRSFDI